MSDDDIIPLRRSYVLSLVERISDLEAEIERLRAVIERMPCNCLPHATPNDGMCNRCMALNKEARRG